MEPISLEKRIQDPAFGEKLTHLYGQEGAGDARARCADALAKLDPAYKRFLYPQAYVVGLERGLADLRDRLVRERMAEVSSALPWKRAR